jgi:hypothetical protein
VGTVRLVADVGRPTPLGVRHADELASRTTNCGWNSTGTGFREPLAVEWMEAKAESQPAPENRLHVLSGQHDCTLCSLLLSFLTTAPYRHPRCSHASIEDCEHVRQSPPTLCCGLLYPVDV